MIVFAITTLFVIAFTIATLFAIAFYLTFTR